MNRLCAPIAFLVLLSMSACTPEVSFSEVPSSERASVSGRVCGADRLRWVEGAVAHVDLYLGKDQWEPRTDWTDAEGRWTLDELPPRTDLTIRVQVAGEVVQVHDLRLDGGEARVLRSPPCLGVEQLSVLSVEGDYDDASALLGRIGITEVSRRVDGRNRATLLRALTGPGLDRVDLLVLHGGIATEGVLAPSSTEGVQDDSAAVRERLVAWVEGGGRILATDWSYEVLRLGWPDAVDWYGADESGAALVGDAPVRVEATVGSAALAEHLGTDVVDVAFDLPEWPVSRGADADTRVLLTADVPLVDGEATDVPIALAVDAAEGRVVHLAFRARANPSVPVQDVVAWALTEE